MRLLKNIFFLLLLIGTVSSGYAQPVITSVFGSNTPYRTGETMPIVGTSLYFGLNPSSCDSVLFRDVSTMDTFMVGFNNYAPTTTVTEISLVIPPYIPCGEYEVQVKTTIATCPASRSFSNWFNSVTIHDSLRFSYPGTGIYCVGEPNQQPLFGPNSDTTELNFYTNPAVGGLFLSSSTGELLVHNGVVGVHDVILTTTNAPACRMTDTFQIEIKAVTNANYSYPQFSYCPLTGTTAPTSIVGVDSIFSIPSVAWNNQSTGTIDLMNTNPGAYIIYFESDSDLCLATDTVHMEVETLQVAAFSFDTAYCDNSGTASPFVTNLPTNFVFSSNTAVISDPATGIVDLGPTLPGTHEVFCGPFILGGCQTADTATLVIRSLPDPTFAYASDTFCVNAGIETPTLLIDSTGIFRDTSGTLSISNVALGSLDIPNTLGNLSGPGPYYLEHVVDDGSCKDSAGTFIYILNTSNVTVNYPGTRYCQGEGQVSPVFTTGSLGGTFVATPTLPATALDPTTGVLTLANVPEGTYDIDYVQQIVGCITTDNVITGLVIDSLVLADFGPLPNNGYYCQDPLQTQITPYTADPNYPNWSFIVEINDSAVAGATSGDFLVTQNLPLGGYYGLSLVQNNGNCSDTLTYPIFIEAQANASFNFLQDTLCGDADDPVPFMMGDSGGVFSFSHPNGLTMVIDPDTGRIDIANTDKDTAAFIVYYVVGTACVDSATDSIVILPANFAEFQYDTVSGGLTEFCTIRDSIPATGFVAGGVFSTSDPINCVVDSTNGMLLISQSVPGSYTVSYQLDESSACEARFTRAIEILQADDGVSWGYPDSVYCPSDSIVSPVVSGLDSTSFVFSNTGLVFTNTDGTINLTVSDSGTYPVTLQILGECSYTIVDTITVLPYVEPWFGYALPFYCTTDTSPRPSIDNPGGTFVAIDNDRDTISYIDPLTGQLNLDSVTSNAQSPFTISYTPNAGCTYTFDEILTVNVGPESAIMTLFPRDTICQGDSVSISAGGGDSYQFILNDTILINSGSPEFVNDFTISPSTDSGTIKVTVFVGNTSACSRQLDTFIVTNPVPSVSFVNLPTTVNSGQNITIDVQGQGTNSIFFDWDALEVGDDNNVNFAPSTGLGGPVNNNQTTFFSTNVSLTDPTSPGQISFVLRPFTQDCPGLTIRDTINLNPEGQEIFIPEVFTPNGDGVNDRWRIQLQQDIDPADYTMLVFNRGGGLVYSMSPINDNWQGDDLPDAVYWWKLIDNRTNRTELTGGVTIIRKRIDF